MTFCPADVTPIFIVNIWIRANRDLILKTNSIENFVRLSKHNIEFHFFKAISKHFCQLFLLWRERSHKKFKLRHFRAGCLLISCTFVWYADWLILLTNWNNSFTWLAKAYVPGGHRISYEYGFCRNSY